MSEVEFEAAGLRELGYGDEIVSDFINLDDKSKIIKDLPSAGEEKRKYLNLINSFTQKEKVSEGQHTCNSCGSKNTTSVLKQLRKNDEGMTSVIKCRSCGAGPWYEH